MQCGVEKRVVRSMKIKAVRCFKCGEEEHKCRWCPLKIKRVAYPAEEKVHQRDKRKLACLERGKVQERKLRRVEGEEAVHPTKGKAQQEECKRSWWEMLRKRAKWYCGPTVPQDTKLWELGWHSQGAIVIYLRCPRCGKGRYYAEDNQGQGVVPYWKREKMSWCGCKGGKAQSSAKRGKRDLYCDKQVEKVVTVLNCVLKGSWGEEGSRGVRKKLKSEYAAYLESKYRRNDGSSI